MSSTQPVCCTCYRIPEEDYLLDAQRLEDSIGSLVMIRAGVQSLQSTFFRLHVVHATDIMHLQSNTCMPALEHPILLMRTVKVVASVPSNLSSSLRGSKQELVVT